jgi:hypothetical protein
MHFVRACFAICSCLEFSPKILLLLSIIDLLEDVKENKNQSIAKITFYDRKIV